MSIEKMKKIEDLKLELNELTKVFTNMLLHRRQTILDQSISKFENYFTNKDFEVLELKDKVVAIYGTLKIEIIVPTAETNFFGAFSVIEIFITTGTEKKNYRVIVNKNEADQIDSRPSVKISTYEKETNLDVEIADLILRNNEISERNKRFSNYTFSFRLDQVDGLKKVLSTVNSKVFNDFEDLLNSMFQ